MKIDKRKIKKNIKIQKGIAHIKITLNNIIITITDIENKTLCWGSAGVYGFKGSKKTTSFAVQTVAKNLAEKAKEFGIKIIDITFSGYGIGKYLVVQAFKNSDLIVSKLKYITKLPHNGCRPPKKRRL